MMRASRASAKAVSCIALCISVTAALAGAPTIALLPGGGDVCYAPTDSLTVDVRLTGAATEIVGGQFYLSYDATRLTYIGGVPGDAERG